MKIVSFGDVHMATRNLRRMDEILRDTDLIIVSGDLTNFGGTGDARKVLDDVRQACPRVLALPGNLDRREVTPFLEAEGIALHGRGVVVDSIGIFGCGGYQTLRRGYAAVQDRRPLLMVCHTPPYETKCDRIVGGKSVGSTAARRFIEEVKPDLCISGHIHESAATDAIGPTTIINAGPFKGGGYVVVHTDGSRLEAKLEFL